MDIQKIILLWPAAMLCGCVGGYQPDLTSPDPSARIRAIRQVAEKPTPSSVPLLVNRLEDEDEGVRFYAIGALVRMTGTDMGYTYYAPEAERLEAVKRWRRYVRDRSTSPDVRPQPTSR